MAIGKEPKRKFSFGDYERKRPGAALPGSRLDVELDQMYSAFADLMVFFKSYLNHDGRLRQGLVDRDALGPTLISEITQEFKDLTKLRVENMERAEQTSQKQLIRAKEVLAEAVKLLYRTEGLQDATEEAKKEAGVLVGRAAEARSRAEAAYVNSSKRASDAGTSSSSARIAEDMAYRWAEKLDGPVFVPEQGDAVDDGFYSAKFWALYAKSSTENGSYYYLGPHPLPPTEGNGGVPLVPGMWYFDTADGVTYVWDGDSWNPVALIRTENYRATDDAGDGSVSDDTNKTDFTSQTPGGTSYIEIDTNLTVVMYHKTVAYMYVGTRPVQIGVGGNTVTVDDDWAPIGVGDHSLLINLDADDHPQYLNQQRHTDIKGNPHDLGYLGITDTPAAWPTYPDGGEVWYPSVSEADDDAIQWRQIRQSDLTEVDRMRWRSPYVPLNFYNQHDMVLDYPWTMVANKDTSDRAAPQLSGSPVWSLPDAPAWTTDASNSGVIHSGIEFTTTEAIQLRGVDVWIPALNTTTNYTIWSYQYPVSNPDAIVVNQMAEPLLSEDEWSTVVLVDTLLYANTVFGIYIDGLDSGDAIAPGGTPADWVRSANDNNNDPAAGNWNRSNDNSTLRIHEQTADAAAIDMLGTIAGSTITFTSTTEAQRYITYQCVSDETATGTQPNRVFSWDVVVDSTGPLGAPSVNERTVVAFVIPQGATTFAKELVGNVTIPAWASAAKGLYREGGASQPWDETKEGNTYGVRVLADTYSVSPDWDIVSAIGGGGGSGGGGTTEPGDGASISVGPVFPDAPDTNALHYLTEQPVGLYLRYDDGNTTQWINTDQAAYNDMASQYLPLTGGVLTGPLHIRKNAEGTEPRLDGHIRFSHVDQGTDKNSVINYMPDASGLDNAFVSWAVVDGNFEDGYVPPAENGGVAVTLGTLRPSTVATDNITDHGILTRWRGDGRYTSFFGREVADLSSNIQGIVDTLPAPYGHVTYLASTTAGAPETSAYNHGMSMWSASDLVAANRTLLSLRHTTNATALRAWIGAANGGNSTTVWKELTTTSAATIDKLAVHGAAVTTMNDFGDAEVDVIESLLARIEALENKS